MMTLSQKAWEDYLTWLERETVRGGDTQERPPAPPPQARQKVTPQMDRWQKSWTAGKCGRPCCFSSHCASHRCSACGQSVTAKTPPLNRYVCVGCLREAKFDESGNAVAMELCHQCFQNGDALHDHSAFVLVEGSSGVHLPVDRTHGIAQRFVISRGNLEELPLESYAPEMDCFCCMQELSADSRRGFTAVGCVASPRHGAQQGLFQGDGLVDGKLYACEECTMKMLQHAGRLEYCAREENALPVMCPVCQFEAERAAWKLQFASISARIDEESFPMNRSRFVSQIIPELNESVEMTPIDVKSESVCSLLAKEQEGRLSREGLSSVIRNALKSLHPQRWLHQLIDEVVR
uniref:Uncharacterized protein n=1 Tax=Chromera velia CCMP2878 TaxID=1169474 RepID=A0A0G4I100_9ALVE|eukprot:Cvel_1649.t1-p1 / transcript=Cvel_1649.t1 / gene=Cvel_1649 / organism=Chromera_velia_CCMP2878 / gene_product=hypothetical protein / transcript_product=hypothetical protein / location=Cvel_scaffold59:109633-110676(+) / protein_length=348 / sequence_SO=supercontig / SO=protein_coding / is_pseudo=false